MKKILALAGAGAILLGMAVPAFAHRRRPSGNVAIVSNVVLADADTGSNTVGNTATVRKTHISGEVEVEGDNTLVTGDADAFALGVVAANTQIGCFRCGRGHGQEVANFADVDNTVEAFAYTGYNEVGNEASITKAHIGGRRGRAEVEVEGNNDVTTGSADADAIGFVVVNTRWTH